MAQTYLEQL